MKFLAWHLGLGDAIICAGLVAKLAEKDRIMVPCCAHNYDSVKSFFVGLDVILVTVAGDGEVAELVKMYDSIKLGHFKGPDMGSHFVDQFYEDAGVALEERYRACPLFSASAKVIQVRDTEPFLLCNRSSLGAFSLGDNYVAGKTFTVPTNHGSILAWRRAVMDAKEIHCVDSAFLHLVEQLPDTGAKLYYHKYARPNSWDFTFKKDWHVLTK